MIYSYKEFLEQVKANILDYISSDLEVEHVQIDRYEKDGESFDGLVVKFLNVEQAKVMNLNGIYGEYSIGSLDFDACMRLIADRNEKFYFNETEIISQFADYDKIKGKIMPVLLNKDYYGEKLKPCVTEDYADLMVAYKFPVVSDGRAGHIYVTPEQVGMWNITLDTLKKDAMENLKNTKFRMNDIISVVCDLLEDQTIKDNMGQTDDLPVMVLTSENYQDGASLVMSEDIMEQVKQRIGEKFVIIPSSKHELILVKTDGMDGMMTENINELICHVNSENVPPEDILSDHLYSYDYNKHELVNGTKQAKQQEDAAISTVQEPQMNVRPMRRGR